jgi:hypothetical protein
VELAFEWDERMETAGLGDFFLEWDEWIEIIESGLREGGGEEKERDSSVFLLVFCK